MEKKSGKRKANEDMGFQGYGLRDNPKKSWKSLGFNGGDDDNATSSSTLEVQCKVCGKQFESMKALFGQMRHHTAKERKEVNCQECGEKFKSLKALTAHMRLHPLKNTTVKRKRSKRSRYNNSNGLNSSVSSLKGSPGFVDTDHDVEEAALCLMMLSKGVRNWTEFISLWEFCDNNDSEIKSFGYTDEFDSYASGSMNVFYDKNISECKDLDSGVLSEKEKDDESGFELYETEIKGRVSGDVMNLGEGLMKGLEFISLWEFCDNNDSEIKSFGYTDEFDSYASGSMNVFYDKNISECKDLDSGVLSEKEKDDESGFELYETEIKGRVSGDVMNLGEGLMKGLEFTGLGNACESEPGWDAFDKLVSTPLNSEMSDDSQRKNKYKCRICSQTFKSHQALGGHQTIHRKGNAWHVEPELVEDCEKDTHVTEIKASCKRVKVENVEDSVDQEMNEVTSPETRVHNKMHRCLVCFKVFRSGQALGGHKRSHISRDPETDDKQPAKQLDLSNISDVIDLNLPVIHTDEANGDTGLKLCRLGTDCKNEALLSLVANC